MPATGSDAYRAKRCKHAFKKQCGETQKTRFSENFTSSIREYFLEQVPPLLAEVAILGYFEDKHRWLLVTSRRIAWSSGMQSQLRYIDIQSMGWSMGSGGRICTHPKQVQNETACKMCLSNSEWFYVLDSAGVRYEIPIEAGTTFGIWDALKLMRRLEEIHPRSDWQ